MSWNLPYRYAQRSRDGASRDYVYFAAWDPKQEKLRRKRIYLDYIKDKKTRDRHARKLIEHINKKLDAGSNPFLDDDNKKKYTSVREALDFVMQYKSMYVRKRTIHSFTSRMNVLTDWLDKKRMLDNYIFEFNDELAITFMNSLILKRKIKGRTYNNYLIDYRTFFNTLVSNNYILKNPFRAIHKMREEEVTKQPFSNEQLKLYFDYLRRFDHHFYVISLYCYYLALRPAEICRLRIHDFHLERGIVIVPATSAKVRKKRIVPVAKNLNAILKEYFTQYPINFKIISTKLCPGEKEIAPTRIAERFREIANHLKLPRDVYFYSLKDTAADRLLEKGFTLKSIRDLFGHSSIAITDKYLKKIRSFIDERLINEFPPP